MIIYGWGQRRKTLGYTAETAVCHHCSNESQVEVFEIARAFTLYFVPVIKWERRYFIACPVCSFGKELAGREEALAILAYRRSSSPVTWSTHKAPGNTPPEGIVSPPDVIEVAPIQASLADVVQEPRTPAPELNSVNSTGSEPPPQGSEPNREPPESPVSDLTALLLATTVIAFIVVVLSTANSTPNPRPGVGADTKPTLPPPLPSPPPPPRSDIDRPTDHMPASPSVRELRLAVLSRIEAAYQQTKRRMGGPYPENNNAHKILDKAHRFVVQVVNETNDTEKLTEISNGLLLNDEHRTLTEEDTVRELRTAIKLHVNDYFDARVEGVSPTQYRRRDVLDGIQTLRRFDMERLDQLRSIQSLERYARQLTY